MRRVRACRRSQFVLPRERRANPQLPRPQSVSCSALRRVNTTLVLSDYRSDALKVRYFRCISTSRVAIAGFLRDRIEPTSKCLFEEVCVDTFLNARSSTICHRRDAHIAWGTVPRVIPQGSTGSDYADSTMDKCHVTKVAVSGNRCLHRDRAA